MSSRGVFFPETCWLNIPMLFFYFGSRLFNFFFFSDKSLEVVFRRDFLKMKVILYLIGNQTRTTNFSITKTLRKIYCISLAYMTVCFNFHQKDSGTLLFTFLEWNLLQSFQFSWLFFSMSTIILIRRASSISLYSIYCYRFK